MATEPTSTGFASGSPQGADMARKVSDTADQARATAAAGLSSAAEAVDDGAEAGANRARRAAHRAAKALSSGADYIRDNSAQEMMDDAMDVVKKNPGVALLGAAAIGYLLGRAFSSRS